MNAGVPILVLALTGSSMAAASAAGEEPARPALSGRWTLDPERSEDGRAKMREAWQAHGGGGSRGGGPGGGHSGGGPPPGGGGGGGGFGGGRRGGGPGGASGGDGFRESVRSLTEAPPALTITEGAEEVTVIEEEGRFRAFHPDGKDYKGTGGEKIVTRWDGARLVVETKSERGPKLVETFEVGADELVAVTRIEGGRGEPVSVRRVYRREPPPQ